MKIQVLPENKKNVEPALQVPLYRESGILFFKKEETMKEFKKLVSAFLVVAMVVTLVTITPSTDANAAVTIYSGKKITLTVGKSEKIYLKQKGAKFKTSNKKKLQLLTGKVLEKAKGIGTCKIKITVGRRSKNSKVTVVPKKCNN